ncbi:uncharacterized protein LOC120583659 [Pteropus medius]|uniref:uncharacterized protein LOC120583659 n=1 Tax=Pteropus vampyrus TaxID=132908 RepID=UPI00196A4DEC|nr:uncharacterized protein LOC120583659 [Pteropus giganteus]
MPWARLPVPGTLAGMAGGVDCPPLPHVGPVMRSGEPGVQGPAPPPVLCAPGTATFLSGPQFSPLLKENFDHLQWRLMRPKSSGSGGTVLPPRGHWVTSWDISVFHIGGAPGIGCGWLQGCCSTPRSVQDAPQRMKKPGCQQCLEGEGSSRLGNRRTLSHRGAASYDYSPRKQLSDGSGRWEHDSTYCVPGTAGASAAYHVALGRWHPGSAPQLPHLRHRHSPPRTVAVIIC